jgi:hypothetical protein
MATLAPTFRCPLSVMSVSTGQGEELPSSSHPPNSTLVFTDLQKPKASMSLWLWPLTMGGVMTYLPELETVTAEQTRAAAAPPAF